MTTKKPENEKKDTDKESSPKTLKELNEILKKDGWQVNTMPKGQAIAIFKK
ncbi:MAG: hypothetical protein HQ552_01500 [Desulfobacteraceae bacterium]|nr:hypothetical protein [Desulfobacteraceae bacterium]